MAVHVAPPVLVNPNVNLFANEMRELATAFGIQLTGEDCADLVVCINNYIKQAVRHDEGAAAGDVKRVLKKIRGALRTAVDELTTVDQRCFENYFRNSHRSEVSAPTNEQEKSVEVKREKEDKAYRVANHLIKLCYWERSKVIADLNPAMDALWNLHRLCAEAEDWLVRLPETDDGLSSLCFEVSRITSRASKHERITIPNLSFVHTLCQRINQQLMLLNRPGLDYGKFTFYKLGVLADMSAKDGAQGVKGLIGGAKVARRRINVSSAKKPRAADEQDG